MRAYIVRGNSAAKKKFVEDFIKENQIAPFNITTFSETLKIADSREIKRTVNIAGSGRRLFIIESSVLPEAQNALLKTLEELTEKTDFIFFDERDLLPTIISRCKIVSAGQDDERDSFEYEDLLYESISRLDNSIASVILLVDKLTLTELVLDDLEIAMRNVVYRFLLEDNKTGALLSSKILNALIDKYQLIKENNLNKKLALERIFFGTLSLNQS